MGQQPVKVGVVDIGTNSMRLLIASAQDEIVRWVRVTGLGQGVDQYGALSPEAIDRSMQALIEFGHRMDTDDVTLRKAIATSASRDAANRESFFDRVEAALGVRPTLISGEAEARYAFTGAVGPDSVASTLVSDIGGGSTEFVNRSESVSIDIGSVRLTDRLLGSSPAGADQVADARFLVAEMFMTVELSAAELVGVAGTWTSLSALSQNLSEYKPELVHGSTITLGSLTSLVEALASMSLAEISAIPSLDPMRAPVILAGAIVAEGVLIHLGIGQAKISERDTLDGVAAELFALL